MQCSVVRCNDWPARSVGALDYCNVPEMHSRSRGAQARVRVPCVAMLRCRPFVLKRGDAAGVSEREHYENQLGSGAERGATRVARRGSLDATLDDSSAWLEGPDGRAGI